MIYQIPGSVLVLLICVQILVHLNCFSQSITMEVWKPSRWKTGKIHRNDHTPEFVEFAEFPFHWWNLLARNNRQTDNFTEIERLILQTFSKTGRYLFNEFSIFGLISSKGTTKHILKKGAYASLAPSNNTFILDKYKNIFLYFWNFKFSLENQNNSWKFEPMPRMYVEETVRLPCWPPRGRQVSHQRLISGNV